MVKDVLRILWKMESMLNLAIRVEMYQETQIFIQQNVRDMIRHCIKKKKAKARTLVNVMLLTETLNLILSFVKTIING